MNEQFQSPAQPPARAITVAAVIEAVCETFGVRRNGLMSMRRKAELCRARFAVYGLARAYTACSLPQIGRALAGRDHSSVLHGLSRFDALIAEDAAFAEQATIAGAALERLAAAHAANAPWDIDAGAVARRVIATPGRGEIAASVLEVRAMALHIGDLEDERRALLRSIEDLKKELFNHGVE